MRILLLTAIVGAGASGPDLAPYFGSKFGGGGTAEIVALPAKLTDTIFVATPSTTPVASIPWSGTAPTITSPKCLFLLTSGATGQATAYINPFGIGTITSCVTTSLVGPFMFDTFIAVGYFEAPNTFPGTSLQAFPLARGATSIPATAGDAAGSRYIFVMAISASLAVLDIIIVEARTSTSAAFPALFPFQAVRDESNGCVVMLRHKVDLYLSSGPKIATAATDATLLLRFTSSGTGASLRLRHDHDAMTRHPHAAWDIHTIASSDPNVEWGDGALWVVAKSVPAAQLYDVQANSWTKSRWDETVDATEKRLYVMRVDMRGRIVSAVDLRVADSGTSLADVQAISVAGDAHRGFYLLLSSTSSDPLVLPGTPPLPPKGSEVQTGFLLWCDEMATGVPRHVHQLVPGSTAADLKFVGGTMIPDGRGGVYVGYALSDTVSTPVATWPSTFKTSGARAPGRIESTIVRFHRQELYVDSMPIVHDDACATADELRVTQLSLRYATPPSTPLVVAVAKWNSGSCTYDGVAPGGPVSLLTSFDDTNSLKSDVGYSPYSPAVPAPSSPRDLVRSTCISGWSLPRRVPVVHPGYECTKLVGSIYGPMMLQEYECCLAGDSVHTAVMPTAIGSFDMFHDDGAGNYPLVAISPPGLTVRVTTGSVSEEGDVAVHEGGVALQSPLASATVASVFALSRNPTATHVILIVTGAASWVYEMAYADGSLISRASGTVTSFHSFKFSKHGSFVASFTSASHQVVYGCRPYSGTYVVAGFPATTDYWDPLVRKRVVAAFSDDAANIIFAATPIEPWARGGARMGRLALDLSPCSATINVLSGVPDYFESVGDMTLAKHDASVANEVLFVQQIDSIKTFLFVSPSLSPLEDLSAAFLTSVGSTVTASSVRLTPTSLRVGAGIICVDAYLCYAIWRGLPDGTTQTGWITQLRRRGTRAEGSAHRWRLSQARAFEWEASAQPSLTGFPPSGDGDVPSSMLKSASHLLPLRISLLGQHLVVTDGTTAVAVITDKSLYDPL